MEDAGPATGYRTVLVVDADERLATDVVRALVAHGLAATAVSSVHHALRLAAVRPPDAWLVERDLPGRGGLDLVRSLRASPAPALRDAVVVGMSKDPSARASFGAAGVDAVVQKPATAHAIAAAVQSALAARSPARDHP